MLRRLALVLAIGAVVAATACSSDEPPRTQTTPKPTPIERLEAASMKVPQRPFCNRIPATAARAAVGKVAKSTAWGNGDKAAVESALTDVVHEFGCSWTGSGGTASAWLFATPVSADQAARLVAEDKARPGCRTRPGPGFGNPSQRQVCAGQADGTRVRVSGLFGDSWLSCEVTGTGPRKVLNDRADAWCVQVANAANRTS